MKIAALEDDPARGLVLEQALERGSHACVRFRCGQALIEALYTEHFDVLLLDRGAGGAGAHAVLHWVRRTLGAGVPVMMLGQDNDEAQVAACLVDGADAYVCEPVRPAELLARVEALARRASLRIAGLGPGSGTGAWRGPVQQAAAGAGQAPEQGPMQGPGAGAGLPSAMASASLPTSSSPSSPDEPPHLVHGVFRFAVTEQRAWVNGTPVVLAPKEFALAVLLFRNIGTLVTRRIMIEQVWRRRMAEKARTIDSHLSRVRTKLGLWPHHGVTLRAIYRMGSRLDAVQAGPPGSGGAALAPGGQRPGRA